MHEILVDACINLNTHVVSPSNAVYPRVGLDVTFKVNVHALSDGRRVQVAA
jgi:hypothetical protein